MSEADQLKALRVRIDSLDERILELISERARCALDVARVKTASLHFDDREKAIPPIF